MHVTESKKQRKNCQNYVNVNFLIKKLSENGVGLFVWLPNVVGPGRLKF